MRHERKKNFVYISIELKKLTMATLAFQTEEEEDEDMKMSHEKKKLRVYMCFSLTHMLYKILLLPFINISNQK